MPTIADFHALLILYEDARADRAWVAKNLDSFNIQTPDGHQIAWQCAMDRERAALRDVMEGAATMLKDFRHTT